MTQALRVVPPPPRLRSAVGAETLAFGDRPVVTPVRAPEPDVLVGARPSPEVAEAPVPEPRAAEAPERSTAAHGLRPALVRGVFAAAGVAIVVLGGALLWMRRQEASGATDPLPASVPPTPGVAAVASPPPPSPTDPGEHPSLPLVLKDVCPGSGCRYGQWWAPASMSVYAAPDSSLVAVSTLAADEAFMALEGQLVAADPATVTLDRTCALTDAGLTEPGSVTLAQGDTVFVLFPDGEGRQLAWHRGQALRIADFWSRAAAGCQGKLTHAGTPATWWVHVRDKGGRSGWVVNPKGHALLEPAEAPAVSAVVAQRAATTPTPKEATDALGVALARVRRAQQEGRVFAPAGDCALTLIADVLALAPRSPEAKRWLDDMAQRVIAEATRSAAESRTDAALARLDAVIASAGTRPELSGFAARLSQKREWLYRATRVFEVGHDHGSKRAAWESIQGDLVQAGCSGSLELTERGLAFRTRESLDRRSDSVTVVATELKELELKDEDTRLRLKAAGQGTWSFVGSPDAMRRVYDHLRARLDSGAR